MLTEIRCEKFLDEGVVRPPVKFGPSLNVVLGSSDGSNSIGKSTFLLIVDFAFGGNAYAESKITLENVGPHRINFAFCFNGVTYRFSRSPYEPNVLWRCDENYEKVDEITVKAFCEWLAVRYGMEKCGGTFRGLVGNFIRVYGKDNYDAVNPLSANSHEKRSEGIKRLLRLFEEYGSIDEAQSRLDDAVKAKKTYSDSLKRNFIAAAQNKREAERNDRKITELESRIAELEEMEHDNLSDLDPAIADRLVDLKGELSVYRRRKTLLVSQARAMEADTDLGRFRITKDFGRLLEFFPDANLKRLEEIELFHEGLTRNLAEERSSQSLRLQDEIDVIDREIASIESEIKEMGSTSNLTKVVLRQYSDIARQVHRLKEANEGYEKKKALNDEARALQGRRDMLIGSALADVQTKMNDGLARLNEYVCGTEANAPMLSLTSPNSYSFGIANDTGTGSQTRALALFDLTVLESTFLPAIALDTVSIKQVGDEPWLRILELYCKADKQVFITFDKAESYSEDGVPEVIEGNCVLELSRGHELFGRSWAIKEGDAGGR